MSLLLLPLFVVVLFTLYVYSKLRVPRRLRHIPSKYGLNWLGEFKNPKLYEVKVGEQMSTIYPESKVQLEWMLGQYVVRILSPESAKQVYNDTITFPKIIPSEANPSRLFSKFLGASVVFSNGSQWKKHRKVVNPPFKKQFEVKTFVDTTRQFFGLIDNLGEGSYKVDRIYKYVQRITMDCMGKDIMGVDFNSIVNPDVEFLTKYNSTMKASMNGIYFVFPFLDFEANPYRKPYFADLHRLNQLFRDILANKRKQLETTQLDDSQLDLLSLLIKAGANIENGFSDLDIQNNITTFLLAGHDTTAFALSAAMHLLATHPEIQEKAREEVMSVMGYTYSQSDATQATFPTLEHTKNMPYLLAIIKETMRLYPSVARLPDRITTKDVELDGYLIPKGTSIMVETYCTHRDKDYFKDPNQFQPERFLDENNRIKDIEGYFPFGGGTRLCLGINFSLLEQKVVLAMILCRYKLRNSTLKFGFRPILLPYKSSIEFIPISKTL